MAADPRARTAGVRAFLIADIRGYTRFTAEHGDEAASRLAGRFAEIAGDGVEAWGGELVELRGDEALAAFESARRALRAAVELQAAFAAEADGDPLLPLRVGIGLDAGEAVPLGDGFRGAALNQAARLCAAAGPGEVLATEGLVHLAGQVGGLAFGPPERTAFKGIDDGVAVIRVRTADEGAASVSGPPAPARPGTPSAVASSATLPPPLSPELDPIVPIIGRDPELRWLRWHWRRARHGSGRTVVVSGQPGIGKTRLAAELATEAHAAGAMVRYVQGGRGHALEAVPAAPADRPLLTVVDDLDAGSPELAQATAALAGQLVGRAHLLLVIHRLEAPPPLQALAATLAPEERRRTVGPLDGAAVRAITGLYVGRAADDAPLGEIVAESNGVPAAVHRVASRWARTAATRRLGLSAGRTSTERHELRAAEDALVDDLADLEHVRDLALLYVDRDTGDGPVQPRTVCPYKGLAAFDAADADYFFGRDRLVAELVAKSVGARFVGLVGDSGSGKSSALRAGLLPALAAGVLPGSDHWPQVVIRPGETPLAEVARALARTFPDAGLPAADAAAALDGALARLAAGHRLLLVVDQFEEIFNATRDEAERSAFVDLLTAERTGLKVIIAMRADHYGRCAVYPALARLLGSEQVLVGPLSAMELAAVIEHPAQRVGLRVEPALTEAIVADAGREPGVLPLLSTTLLELWGLREGGRLTLASYRATGGLHGAIARLAEATFAELDPHRQRVARSLLLRLAGPGEGTALVRRSVALDELDADSDPAVADVLGRLTAARLLTTGEGHVEVAHEALLREWPRLQGWLDEDAAGRQVRLHLIGAVRDWETRGRDAGDLYRGARLATALEWAADRDMELNAAERAFLDGSRRAAEADVERARRTNRRLKGLLAGAAALLLVAVGAGAVALGQGQRAQEEAERAGVQAERAAAEAARAEEQREIAEQEAGRARSRELLASALVATDEDPALAKALAAAALDGGEEPTLQATRILHDVIAADPVVARYRAPTDAEMGLLWTDLDPAGERLVASGNVDDPAQHLEVADARTGEVAWSFDVEAPTRIGPAFFSPDGSTVVVGVIWDDEDVPPTGDGLGIQVRDARTGEILRTFDAGRCGGHVTGLAGNLAMVRTIRGEPGSTSGCSWYGDGDPGVEILDLSSGASRVLESRALMSFGGTLSADGRFAAFDVPEGVGLSVVVDVASGRRLLELDPREVGIPQARGYARLLSPDGSLLLYGDRPILVYDVAQGPAEPIAQLPSPGGEGFFATFDAGGEMVYTTARDRTLRAWDPRTAEAVGAWPAVGNGPVSYADDGRTLLVGSTIDAGAALLDVGPRGELGGVATCDGFVPAGSLVVGAGRAAFMSDCGNLERGGRIEVVDLASLRQVASHLGWGAQRMAISPDGALIAAQEQTSETGQGPVRLVDPATGSVVRTLEGLCSWDWNVDEGEDPGCRPFPEPPFPMWAAELRWSPDGALIAMADGPQVALWSAADGRLRATHELGEDAGVQSIAFTPDSRELLLAEHGSGRIARLSVDGLAVLQSATLDADVFGIAQLRLIGLAPDGATILAVGDQNGDGGAAVFGLNAETLEIVRSVPDAHLGSPKSFAISPDRSAFATGASDGAIKVWDSATGELLQQLSIGARQVQGLAFVDDHTLAAVPREGGVLLMTIDPAELVAALRGSLTRGLTASECATYAIDPCPTLEELRGQPAP